MPSPSVTRAGTISTCVVTPIFEELVFRKLFIDRVHIYGEGMAILASGLLYALYQGDFTRFFFSIGLGAFFAYIYIRTGKIWYTIIFRMICELSLTIAVLVLSSSREVINPSDGMENLGIGIEVAAVTRGQDVPLFEVREGMFNSDPAAREFGIASLLGSR